MPSRLVHGHTTKAALRRPHVNAVAKQHADFRLLRLGDEKRPHAGDRSVKCGAADVPAVGRFPVCVLLVSTPERPPHRAARDLLTSFKKDAIYAGGSELRIDMSAAMFGDRLKRSLALNKPGKPSPFNFCGHARILPRNPAYAEIARKRLLSDGGMFAEVA